MLTGDRPRTDDPGRVIAHRGASRVAPENTLSAFRIAAGMGARWIEFDVSLLGDGTPVVFHDDTLDRCTDASGPLGGIARADLARIHAGARHGPAFATEPLPTLEAVLDLIVELGLHANLEIKPHDLPAGATAAAVVEALKARSWAARRILVSSFAFDEITALRKALPGAPVAMLCWEPPEGWLARLTALDADALHVHVPHLRRDLIAEARAHGFGVRTFTTNDPRRMVPFRNAGLTGVITDHPPLFLDNPGWAGWAESKPRDRIM